MTAEDHDRIACATGIRYEDAAGPEDYLDRVWTATLTSRPPEAATWTGDPQTLAHLPWPDSFAPLLPLSTYLAGALFACAFDDEALSPAAFAVTVRRFVSSGIELLAVLDGWRESYWVRCLNLAWGERPDWGEEAEWAAYVAHLRAAPLIDEREIDAQWNLARLNPSPASDQVAQDIEDDLFDGTRSRVWHADAALPREDDHPWQGYEALQEELAKRETGREEELAEAERGLIQARRHNLACLYALQAFPPIDERHGRAFARVFEAFPVASYDGARELTRVLFSLRYLAYADEPAHRAYAEQLLASVEPHA